MRAAEGRQERRGQPDPIEFVPTQELEQAERQIQRQQREIERHQRENERLKQENERLRKELEAALRAGKRPAAPHSRGTTKEHPPAPGPQAGPGLWEACLPSYSHASG